MLYARSEEESRRGGLIDVGFGDTFYADDVTHIESDKFTFSKQGSLPSLSFT